MRLIINIIYERKGDFMSVVIVGGHERMERIYKDLGKKYGCKIKVFTHMETNFNKRVGNPDYIFMMTDTMSHKLLNNVSKITKQKSIPSYKIQSASINSLEEVIKKIKNN